MKKSAFTLNFQQFLSCPKDYQSCKLRAGFTLIELLVVIVIIGILATISVAQFNSYQEKARLAKYIAEASQRDRQIKLCYDEFGSTDCQFSQQTCTELDWSEGVYNVDKKIAADCSYSMGITGSSCLESKTWYEAYDFCDSVGARLCTTDEIKSGMTSGSGCNFDGKMVWTGTPCDSNGFYLSLGRWHDINGESGRNTIAAQYCVNDLYITEKTANMVPSFSDPAQQPLAVRCCADED